MPVLEAPLDWTHELPNARFRSLATPTRGTRETSVWRVSLVPGAEVPPHSLTREEIFVVLSGEVGFAFAGVVETARAGDAVVVPAELAFTARPIGDAPVELLCCLPVGGQARLASGELITPPWAQ